MLPWLQKCPPWFHRVIPLLLVFVVGVLDFYTGTEISVSSLYLLGIAPATWFVSERYGMLLSLLSASVTNVGDLVVGTRFSNPVIPAWNTLVLLVFYLVVVRALSALRSLYLQLEERILLRTAALNAEIAARTQLEQELLDISEREQQRIGHDLHDSISQHLTGTALAGEVLAQKLEAKAIPESAAARRIVSLVEDGIAMTRSLTRELAPMPASATGLMEMLQELAATVTERLHVHCRFVCDAPVSIRDPAITLHLYRITQEAINNAIRHGQARSISLLLEKTETGTVLEVTDDGSGLPDPLPEKRGMGLRIMNHRTTMIHGTLNVRRGAAGGTIVTCIFP